MRQKPIIEIYLQNKEDYKNPFNENKLSEELSNYILEECKGLSYNCKIELDIKTKFKMSSEERIKLISMLRSKFGLDVRENLVYMNNLVKKNIFLFLFGCLFIVISVGINELTPIMSEIILIIGWVSVWEVVYSLFFSDYKRRLQIKRFRQLSNSKIKFM